MKRVLESTSRRSVCPTDLEQDRRPGRHTVDRSFAGHTSIAAFLCTTVMLAVAGCQSSAPEPARWEVVSPDAMNSAQTTQREQAVAARDAMFSRLKKKLIEAIGTEGVGGAIVVCSEEAPRIAANVAQEHDVAIGRTSFRLRNPENTPPEWAKGLVAERIEESTFLSRGERLAALLPIRLQVPCLMCHGPAESLPPEVKDALDQHYPNDEATGFEQGQLRGWFWVEVPGDTGG